MTKLKGSDGAVDLESDVATETATAQHYQSPLLVPSNVGDERTAPTLDQASSVVSTIENLGHPKVNLTVEPGVTSWVKSLGKEHSVRKCSGIGWRSVDEAIVRFAVKTKSEFGAEHSQQSLQVVSRRHLCHAYPCRAHMSRVSSGARSNRSCRLSMNFERYASEPDSSIETLSNRGDLRARRTCHP